MSKDLSTKSATPQEEASIATSYYLSQAVSDNVVINKFFQGLSKGNMQYTANPLMLPEGWNTAKSPNPTGFEVADFLIPTLTQRGLINSPDPKFGNTALHFYVLHGNLGKVKEFLPKMGAKIGHKNIDGQTAAHLAILKGQSDIASFLVENTSIEAMMTPNKFGVNCLHLAITGDSKSVTKIVPNAQLAKLLINKCLTSGHPELLFVKSTEGNSNLTPLEQAIHAAKNCSDMNEVILELIPSIPEGFQFTCQSEVDPIVNAARTELQKGLLTCTKLDDFQKISKMLPGLKLNDKVDPQGNTLLHLHSRNGNKEIVEFLLKNMNNEDINLKTLKGATAILDAVLFGQNDIASILLDHTSVNSVMEVHPTLGQNCLHILIDKAILNQTGAKELSAKIITKCASENPSLLFVPYYDTSNSTMMTPLEKAIIAVKAGKVEAMESVVKALTNVIPSGQQFEFLKDLLFKLVDAGNIDEIKNYLPEFKSLNLINQADKDGNTVLHHALKTANTELIQLLINNTSPYLPKSINNVGISVEKQINEIKGILLELKDNLFSDVRSGNYASVKGLLPQLKALDLISGTDKSGNTVLHVAALKGNKAMIELLVPHVNPAVKNSTGHTAFLNAIILNHFEAAKLLLEHMPIESVMERHPDLKQNAFHALTLKAGLFHNNQHILELSSKIIEKCKFVDPKLLFIPYFCSESGLMVTPLERIFLTMSVDQTLGDPLTDLTCLIPAGQEFQLFSTLPHEIMDGLNMSIKDCHDSYQQHLFNFIKAGDVKNIKDYLPEFKNLKVINETDTAGNTVLHQAAKGGNLELFELLLKNTSPEVLHKTNIAGENVLEVALNSEHANSNITTILLNLFESNEDLPHILEIDLSGQDGSNNFLDQ